MTPSSEQLEQESERTRARLAETLEELRARLTPGQVVDQLFDYAREGSGGEFVRNLGHEVRRHPLPVTLIGAGIGWLMIANSRSLRDASEWREDDGAMADGRARSAGFLSRRHTRSGGEMESLKTTARSAGDVAKTTWSNLSDSAGDAAEAVGDTTRNLGSTVADTAREAKWRVSSAAGQAASTAASARDTALHGSASIYASATDAAHSVTQSATRAGRNAERWTRSFTDFCAEQPLVLAGLGLALGAAIGTALPSSETENRLMGETSGALKEKAQEGVSELYQKAETVVRNVTSEAVETVSKAAKNAGLSESTREKPTVDRIASDVTTAPAST
jgi:hypothetical protein